MQMQQTKTITTLIVYNITIIRFDVKLTYQLYRVCLFFIRLELCRSVGYSVVLFCRRREMQNNTKRFATRKCTK